MLRAVVYTAAIAVLLSGGATAATGATGEARRLEDRPRVARCAERHPWTQVGQREELVWCIAHAFDSPGSPRTAIAVGHCESGTDLQDAYAGDGYVGTFQHITSRWHARWVTWGKRIGVKDAATNVLSQAVVSVRMARSLGTWNSSAGWAGCA
jgi:hypothetical protein